MNPSVVALVSFAGIAAVIAALGMFLRDLVFGGRREGAEQLRRMPLAKNAHVSTGMFSDFDIGFTRFVVETGLDATPWGVLLLMMLCALAIGGGAFLYWQDPIAGCLAAMFGLFAPMPFLMHYRRKYMSAVREQLPDILDMVARALRAGESLDQAIEMAGERGGEPLGREFRRCAKQLQMGLALPSAMRAIRFRIPLMEVQIFTTTLSVYRQTGGNLALTLERMAGVIRDRLIYQRQVRAATAAGRFSGTIVSAAGPLLFLFMFLFQPEYARKLVGSPLGQSLTAIAVFLEVLGLIWMYRLSRMEP